MKEAQKGSSRYFRNDDCEYFPCHVLEPGQEEFNCLFCYCPLYALGEDCGGEFHLLPNGVKDCSACLFPHKKENYDCIMARMEELIKRVAKGTE